MTEHVDDDVRRQGWPPDKFHPVYDSFRDWLDHEAPVEQEDKQRNRPKYRIVRRKS